MPMLARSDVIGLRVRGGVAEFVLGQQPAGLHQQQHMSHRELFSLLRAHDIAGHRSAAFENNVRQKSLRQDLAVLHQCFR